jgi:hypothetical protein
MLEKYIKNKLFKDLSVIKKGTVISIKHPNLNYSIINVIQKVDDKTIYFRVPDDFVKNNVLEGDEIYIKILAIGIEYILTGKIFEIELTYPSYIHFCVDKVEKFKNNRRYDRYFVNINATIGTVENKNIHAVIKNISINGISLVFKELVETNDILDVSFYFTKNIEGEQKVKFKAKIVRKISVRDKFNEYGLEIVNIDSISKERMDSLIEMLEEDEKIFVANCLK